MKYRKLILTVVVEEREEKHHPEYKASYETNGVFFKHQEDGRKTKAIQIESCGLITKMSDIVSNLDQDISGALRDDPDA